MSVLVSTLTAVLRRQEEIADGTMAFHLDNPGASSSGQDYQSISH